MNQICQKTLKETLKYDPLTGHFTWIEAKAVRQQANITYNFHPNHGT